MNIFISPDTRDKQNQNTINKLLKYNLYKGILLDVFGIGILIILIVLICCMFSELCNLLEGWCL